MTCLLVFNGTFRWPFDDLSFFWRAALAIKAVVLCKNSLHVKLLSCLIQKISLKTCFEFMFRIDFHSPGSEEALAIKGILTSRDWDFDLSPSAILIWRLSVPCMLYYVQKSELAVNWYFYSVQLVSKKRKKIPLTWEEEREKTQFLQTVLNSRNAASKTHSPPAAQRARR